MVMKKLLLETIALTTSAMLFAEPPEKGDIINTEFGPVSIAGDWRKHWTLSAETESPEEGMLEVTFQLKTIAGEAPLPKLTLSWSIPQHDIQYRWHTAFGGAGTIPPDWSGAVGSSLSGHSPILVLFGNDGMNRLTFCVSDAIRKVEFKAGVCEETNELSCSASLFTQPESPAEQCRVVLRFDRRKQTYAEAVQSASRWFEKFPENRPLPAPEAAFEPFYSTWYSYHHKIFADELEKECALAVQYGMKGLLVDGGWYADDDKRGCDFWGDGEVSKLRFPDMRGHVARIHALGMKYVMWFGLPFIGYHSKAFQRFQGKFINDVPFLECSSLDPRFPEVREYLIGVCERMLREWDIDGFKFDFIDKFQWNGEDPAIRENYAGRDIRSLPLAVDHLLFTMTERLRKIKKDILIEFRQPYIGPSIRKYGNMFRVTDCPGDSVTNRVGSVNLRLTSGATAVHSDMLEWHMETSAEDAARQLLAVLFAVPQISVKLENLPETHRKMLKFYLDFMIRHRETLLKGKFVPLAPEARYPQIRAEKDGETVIAVYGKNQIVELPETGRCCLFNATAEPALYVNSVSGFRGRAFDVCGESAGSEEAFAGGLLKLPVPVSGMFELKINKESK